MNKKIIKVCIFDKHSTPSQVLSTNGDAILDNICTDCRIDEGLDSLYNLDATFIVDKEGLYKNISDEAILKVQVDYGEEIFRIAKSSKKTRDVIVFARQITIAETLDMWVEDVRPTNTNGLGALSSLKNNSIGKKDIQVFSDITSTSTAYYQDMNMYKALHDSEQSFIKRWGGEVQRRGYNLTINKRVGTDRGVQIRSNKNLTGFEADTNIDTVFTRLKVKGFDGIEANVYVDSSLIGKYSSIKTKEIKYDDVKVKDESNPNEGFNTLAEAQAELIRRAKLEFTEKHIDELRADYRINFVYLEQTEEYKNYVQAERVYIGDTIYVYEQKHDINISVRAIRRKFDVLRQRVIEIELSNTDIKQKTITTSDIIAELGSIINKTENNNVSEIIQSMINSGIKDSYVIPRQNELIVADNKDINLANNLIRINKNGLAFSKTGYYGNYDYGFTIDGVINASLIATGILSTILIQNADGSLQIDLSGTNGIMTKKNGKNAIELAGPNLKFYDWDGIGDNIGQIFSSRLGGNENQPGLVLANKLNSFLSLSYEKDNNFYPYLRCDKDNIDNTTPTPITIFEDTEFKGSQLWFGYDKNSIFKSTSDDLVVRVLNKFIVQDKSTLKARFEINNDGFTFWNNSNAYLFKVNNYEKIWCDYDFTVDKNVYVNGDLAVVGTKNCVQKTENYGDILFYSVEDCESYLTDRSMELFAVEEIVSDGVVTFERVILLDNIFKESVRTDIDYTVEIIKQGWGDYRVKEQNNDYFIVESDRVDFTFKYIVTGKRRGYEDARNNKIYLDEKVDTSPSMEY